jgi:hypothetical protein
MAEQPTPPAEQASTEPASELASEPEAERVSAPPKWWQRLMGRREEPEPEAAEPEPSAETQKLVLNEQELERRIQAETDRREAKRLRDAKAAERRKLRDEDPWKYAEEERKAEEVAASDAGIMQLFANVGVEHDKVTIDPIFVKLPESERERILKLEGAGRGLEGRKLIVDETLKALEKHWKAEGARDAEARLRRNSAFRKQVLAEIRGDVPEPELLPSGPPSNGRTSSQEVNDMLRRQIGLHQESD